MVAMVGISLLPEVIEQWQGCAAQLEGLPVQCLPVQSNLEVHAPQSKAKSEKQLQKLDIEGLLPDQQVEVNLSTREAGLPRILIGWHARIATLHSVADLGPKARIRALASV